MRNIYCSPIPMLQTGIGFLCQRFSSLYNPQRELSVDEAMIKFQGHSSLEQYMPKKPIKLGIKECFFADSTNGYFSLLEVYSGKWTEQVEKGLVQGLCGHCQLTFRASTIMLDNYFTYIIITPLLLSIV